MIIVSRLPLGMTLRFSTGACVRDRLDKVTFRPLQGLL